MSRKPLVLGLGILLLGACGGDDKKVENTCEPQQTFALVGEPFLRTYCQSCHNSASAVELGGGHAFEKEADLRSHGDDAYELVDSGEMPRSGPRPPEDQKAAFLAWLQCSGISQPE